MSNSPLFQRRQVYDNPARDPLFFFFFFFFKKKILCEWPYFLMLVHVYEWHNFSDTYFGPMLFWLRAPMYGHVNAHIFRMKGYINSKDSIFP